MRLPWKTVPPEIFYSIGNIFFIIQNLQQLALALKNRVRPEIFHCTGYTFYIQDFWTTCACPENRLCPEFIVLNIYFLSFRILNNLRLPCKAEFPLNIFTVLKYFLSFRIFVQLVLAPKTVCPEFVNPASYATASHSLKSNREEKFNELWRVHRATCKEGRRKILRNVTNK